MRIHLIRFPNDKEAERGLMTMLDAGGEIVGLPDDKMVVTDRHLDALKAANVRFVLLSKTAKDGKHSKAV